MKGIVKFLREFGAPGLLIVFSVYHSATSLVEVSRTYRIRSGPDPVTAYELRFDPLKRQLSMERCSKISYITDLTDASDWFIDYFRTQYTLAPVIVDDSTDCQLVITNLRISSSLDQVIQERHLLIVRNYGDGLALLSERSE